MLIKFETFKSPDYPATSYENFVNIQMKSDTTKIIIFSLYIGDNFDLLHNNYIQKDLRSLLMDSGYLNFWRRNYFFQF